MVIGFLTMIVILNPIKILFSNQTNLEDEILKTSNQIELNTARMRLENIEINNSEAVINLYKQEVKKQLKDSIEKKTEYKVEEINLQVREDRESVDFGMLESMEVILREGWNKEKAISQNVEPVNINVSVGKNINNTVEASGILISNEITLLKDEISSAYYLPREKIDILILQNRNKN